MLQFPHHAISNRLRRESEKCVLHGLQDKCHLYMCWIGSLHILTTFMLWFIVKHFSKVKNLRLALHLGNIQTLLHSSSFNYVGIRKNGFKTRFVHHSKWMKNKRMNKKPSDLKSVTDFLKKQKKCLSLFIVKLSFFEYINTEFLWPLQILGLEILKFTTTWKQEPIVSSTSYF